LLDSEFVIIGIVALCFCLQLHFRKKVEDMKPALSPGNRVIHVAYVLGMRDIKRTYQRSKLGFFRLFLNTILSLVIIVPIFATIQERDLSEFLAYVASGLLIWSFISDAINDSAVAYLASARTIRQIAIPRVTFVFQRIIRNALMLIMSLSIFPIIMVISKLAPTPYLLLLPIGLFITVLCVTNIGIVLATLGARFRDLPAIVSAVMRVLFFLSPIIWVTERIDGQIAHFILGLNPFYHLLQIVRLPLLGEMPTSINWALSVFALIASSILAYGTYRRFDSKIAYWV
jgi:lipopolysaccharide transport system permease protein